MKRPIATAIAALIVVLGLGILFAIAQRHRVVAESVVIEAPLEDVWAYIGDSRNAQQWSVFFHHITPLPGTPPDGTVGAVRRCFRRADETGINWDEELIALAPLGHRKIHVFNLREFRAPRATETQFLTTQTYKRLGPKRTQVTFSGWLHRRDDALQHALFGLSSPEAARVFRLNLENIKAAVEQRPRPHPWEGQNILD